VNVILDVGRGRHEILDLLQQRQRDRAELSRAPSEALRGGVSKTGPHSYEIRRATLEGLLAGGITPPLPRIVPQTRDGEPVGLRLFGIGSDGPLAMIGLMNGDLLVEVNGRPLTSPDAALNAYAALRTASHVWLVVERAGQRIRTDYVIR